MTLRIQQNGKYPLPKFISRLEFLHICIKPVAGGQVPSDSDVPWPVLVAQLVAFERSGRQQPFEVQLCVQDLRNIHHKLEVIENLAVWSQLCQELSSYLVPGCGQRSDGNIEVSKVVNPPVWGELHGQDVDGTEEKIRVRVLPQKSISRIFNTRYADFLLPRPNIFLEIYWHILIVNGDIF